MIEYSLPYERLVWGYKKANINLFSNRSVHQQVKILNNNLMNVFSNFISNKLVTFNEKDLPWMSKYLKNKIEWRNKIYAESLDENNDSVDYITL